MDKILQIKSKKKFLTIGVVAVLATFLVNASTMPVLGAPPKPEGTERSRCEAQEGNIWLDGKCIELPKPDDKCKGIKKGNTCISGEITDGGKGAIGTITIRF